MNHTTSKQDIKNNLDDKPAFISDSVSESVQTALQTAKQQNDRAFITALGRGILLLSLFEHHAELTHQQLCQLANLPKATVSRLLHTLVTLNFVTRTTTDSYRLSRSLLRLSANAWQQHDIASEAQPLLKEFALKHKVSVNIATEYEVEMQYVACYRSPARLAVNLNVGSSVPIVQTAIGRAYFSALDSNEQQQILETLKSFVSAQEHKKNVNTLNSQSQFYRQHGYCVSDGDYSPDILAVAVPLYDAAKDEYTHAINASVPKTNWDIQTYIGFIVPKLQDLAAQIEIL